MSRSSGLLILTLLAAMATGAAAQEPPAGASASPPAPTSLPPAVLAAPPTQSVEVEALAAPDAFTTPGRDTGLPATLWRGASLKTLESVLPLLAARPLSPAGAALARRVLATGAQGPKGANDPALTGARATALLGQGDPKAAGAILARAPGVDRTPELAHAAAESALLAGDDARACKVAEGLASGRDDVYWLRLRTYCQAIGGHADQAQLTFDLAQAQAKDPVFGRLMSAKLAGVGNPGAPSLRNGLDYALSRSLGLDLAAAKASPAVAAALSGVDPAASGIDIASVPPEFAAIAQLVASGQPAPRGAFLDVMNTLASGPKSAGRVQAAMMLLYALETPTTVEERDQLTQFTLPEGKAPLGRDIALDIAGSQKFIGEAAMLALWTCADAGAGGPAIGDRVRIVRALHQVGLEADARAFALEGLLALK